MASPPNDYLYNRQVPRTPSPVRRAIAAQIPPLAPYSPSPASSVSSTLNLPRDHQQQQRLSSIHRNPYANEQSLPHRSNLPNSPNLVGVRDGSPSSMLGFSELVHSRLSDSEHKVSNHFGISPRSEAWSPRDRNIFSAQPPRALHPSPVQDRRSRTSSPQQGSVIPAPDVCALQAARTLRQAASWAHIEHHDHGSGASLYTDPSVNAAASPTSQRRSGPELHYSLDTAFTSPNRIRPQLRSSTSPFNRFRNSDERTAIVDGFAEESGPPARFHTANISTPPTTPPSRVHLGQMPSFHTTIQTPGTERRTSMFGFSTPSRGLTTSPTTSLYPILPSPPTTTMEQPHASSSQTAHRAMKRGSPSYQLPLSSSRPRMYRRVGANYGLGLHIPSASLPMSAYQISAGSNTSTSSQPHLTYPLADRRLQDHAENPELLQLQPPHTTSLQPNREPHRMKLTLPRLDVLDMPNLGPSPISRSMMPSWSGSVTLGQPTLDVTSPHRPQSSPAAVRISDAAGDGETGPDVENDDDSLLCSSSEADTHFEDAGDQARRVASFVSSFPRSNPVISAQRPPARARNLMERATGSVLQGLPTSDERDIRIRNASDPLSGNLVVATDHARTRSRSERGTERNRSSMSTTGARSNLVQASGSTSSSFATPAQGDRSPTSARDDLIEHAYNLKLFLAFAPEVLFMEDFERSPQPLGSTQHTTRRGMVHNARSMEPSWSESFAENQPKDTMTPVEGSMFITRPRASKHGNSVLETLSSIPIRPTKAPAAASSGSATSGNRSSSEHQFVHKQARCPSDIEIMLSNFETFYIAESKARHRLARARESNMAKGTTGLSAAHPTAATTSLRAAATKGKKKVGRPKKVVPMSSFQGNGTSSRSIGRHLPPMPIVHRFPLPLNNFEHADEQPQGRDEVFVSCVLWDGQVWLTGTDICRIIRFRFETFGRKIVNVNKFHEGIYSDLRNVKAGDGATCEEPRSPFLEALFIYDSITCSKRQKVFHWLGIAMHDQLFLDQLSRDLERGVKGEAMCTEAIREPARSFRYDPTLSLADQLGLEKADSGRPALQIHASYRPRTIRIDRAALYALALGLREN